VPKWELQIQLTTNRLIHKPSIDEGWVEPAQTTFSANKMSQVKAAVGFSSFAQEIISICRLKVLTPAKMASQICFQASEEKKQRCKLWKLQGRTIQKFSRNGKKVVPVISTKSVAALAGQDIKHAVHLLLPLYCLTNLADVYSSKGSQNTIGQRHLKVPLIPLLWGLQSHDAKAHTSKPRLMNLNMFVGRDKTAYRFNPFWHPLCLCVRPNSSTFCTDTAHYAQEHDCSLHKSAH
jgi:hypothetical protein